MDVCYLYDRKGIPRYRAIEYDGFKFWVRENPKEMLEVVNKRKYKESDVCIVSYPRSGTHWIFEIVNMLTRGKAEYYTEFLPYFYSSTDLPSDTPISNNGIYVSHLLPKHLPKDFMNKQCKIIHVYRNPKDAFVSSYEFGFKTMRVEGLWEDFTLENFVEMHLDGNVPRGSWFDWIKSWRDYEHQHPEHPILTISYEEMKKDLKAAVWKIADFLGLHSSSLLIDGIVKKCNYEEMHKCKNESVPESVKSIALKEYKDSHIFYRKGDVGDWKNHFSVALNEYFDQRMQGELSKLDLEISYTI